MYKLLSKVSNNYNINNNSKSLIKLTKRLITYEVLPSGEKVVVNKDIDVISKREEWQRVRPMGSEKELRNIKNIEKDERLESDPRVARKTASNKLQSLKDSLLYRGFCRETKPYTPPSDVENKIKTICAQVFGDKQTQEWSHILLNDSHLKYKFLTNCSKVFDYEVPNSVLFLIKTVSDVHKFYSTPIRGVSSYDQMVRNADELPQNLHVIGDPIRYNPANDQFFGGINAYPFSGLKVHGLRAKKKYPSFEGHFKWPDV